MTLSRAILLFMVICKCTLPAGANPVVLDDPGVCTTPACQEAAQALQDSMDTSADPCQDFYRYACGGWVDKHPIPDGELFYIAAEAMKEKLHARVIELLRNAANEDHVKPIRQAAILFEGCMDKDARERQGLIPLKNLVNSLGGWPMINPVWSDVGYRWEEQVANATRMFGEGVIVDFSVTEDPRERSHHVIFLDQHEVEKDKLLNSSEGSEEAIEAYKNRIVQSAKLLNPDADESQLTRDAQEMIDFEKGLAQFTKPPVDPEDMDSWYNKMSVADADRITENTYFKWKDFLNIVLQDYPEVTDQTEIIITYADYLKNALKLVHGTNIRTVANYVGWNLVKAFSDETTREFQRNNVDNDDDDEESSKSETTCLETVSAYLGFALGRLYVDKYFPEEAKCDIEAIVDDLRSTFEFSLNHNTWMDPDTKNKALEKLRAMKNMIAYPTWIKNDQELINYYRSVPDVKVEEYFESITKVSQAATAMELKMWNKPVDKTRWDTPLLEVNAFYDVEANAIKIPVGYLNLPEYMYGRPAALNYGGIGSTIGHEISHGFDDTGTIYQYCYRAGHGSSSIIFEFHDPITVGVQYDKEGNKAVWWSKETEDKFDSKATCFKRQYSSQVEPITKLTLNGNLTIGDDIADNGGLRNSFLAYQIRVLEQEDQQTTITEERLPGIDATPNQLLFLAYATTYCSSDSKESLKWRIENSDHTIDQFRVAVSVSNSRDFAETFSCPPGSPMNPSSRCVLW